MKALLSADRAEVLVASLSTFSFSLWARNLSSDFGLDPLQAPIGCPSIFTTKSFSKAWLK